MKPEIFYRRYANMSLGKRFVGKLITTKNGIEQNYTPSELYNRIKICEETIAENEIKLKFLLEVAEQII
jgi:hypothetical protein